MRSWFLYALLTWASICPAYSRIDYNSPSQIKEAPTWQERQSALHEVQKHYPLSDTATQAAVIALFERETNNPNWEALEEEIPYENYYQEVSDLCQKIAENYHNQAAWHALVFSNYNEDSKFGLWLISQPEALSLFFQMLHDPNPGLQDRAIVLLAEALQRCRQPRAEHCSVVLAKRNSITSLIYKTVLAPEREVAGIRALGICGTTDDLALLERVAARERSRRIDPANRDASNDQRAGLWLVDHAEKQIKARESNHSVKQH